ncbi:MAG: type II toxin-antitoxin system VapC family toxin [Candidatus Micrarchaeia archaeon]
MEKICLDSCAALEFLKGEPTIVEKIKYYSDEEICITTPTIFELMISVRKTEIVDQFVKNITTFPFNESSGIIASRVYKELKEIGIFHPVKNIINAAICIDNNAFLFTTQRKNYEKIRRLKLV